LRIVGFGWRETGRWGHVLLEVNQMLKFFEEGYPGKDIIEEIKMEEGRGFMWVWEPKEGT
jgi:hypothetical protein